MDAGPSRSRSSNRTRKTMNRFWGVADAHLKSKGGINPNVSKGKEPNHGS